MKLFKKYLTWAVILVLIIAVLGWMIPRHTTMDRAIDIDTHAAPIYQVLITPKRTPDWSPWAEGTAYEYEGHHAGEGAILKWDNDETGSGVQTWVRCVHNKSVRTEVYFGDNHHPSYASFILDEFDGYTEVTWQLVIDYGPNPFMHYLTLFTERTIGPDYEKGLHQLKRLVESEFMHDEELDIELEGDALVDSLKQVMDI